MKRIGIIVAVLLFAAAAHMLVGISQQGKQTDYFERVAGRPA